MNLYFNTDTLNFVNGPTDFTPVGNVSFIFGSTQDIGVTLVNANRGKYILASGYNLVLGLKPVGTYLTGNYLAYGATNIVPNTGLGNYSYSLTGFNLYNVGISGLLANNGSISLAMELEYDNNGSGVVLSNPNTCTIFNSYINLDQAPFITGNLVTYPAPNNIQTITNAGVTYAPLVGGLVPTGYLPGVSGVGYAPYSRVSGNFTISAGKTYGIDTSSASVTASISGAFNDGDWFKAFDVAKKWATHAAVIGSTGNHFIDFANPTSTVGPYNLNAVPFVGQGILTFVWDSALSVWSVN